MAWKKTLTLGKQAIPNFARTATLCEAARCFTTGDDPPVNLMPEVGTVYDIACLAFFRRLGVKQFTAPPGDLIELSNQPLSITWWSNNVNSGVPHRYGLDTVVIPAGAEWFSVAWFAPPDGTQTNSPDPDNFPPWEDTFRIRWGLAI